MSFAKNIFDTEFTWRTWSFLEWELARIFFFAFFGAFCPLRITFSGRWGCIRVWEGTVGRKSAYRQLVVQVWTSGIYHPSPRPSDSLQTDTAGTWNHWTMDTQWPPRTYYGSGVSQGQTDHWNDMEQGFW